MEKCLYNCDFIGGKDGYQAIGHLISCGSFSIYF